MSTPDPQPSQRIEHSSIQGSQIQQGQAGKKLTQIQTETLTQVYVSLFGSDRRTNIEKLHLDLAARFLKDPIQPELEQRLRDTLHQNCWLNSELEEQPHQVGGLAPDRIVDVPGRPSESLDLQTTILEVFARPAIRGRLLILGEPGVGKTTTLLALANQLVQQALANPGTAIPVIFELSSWKDDDQKIQDWLVKQLQKMHPQLTPKVTRRWLEEELLLPLLDGLDELGERQSICIQRLNEFADHYPGLPFVVCCRADEYASAEVKLAHRRGAVRLQPLTPHQVQSYLQQARKPELWNLIETQPEMQALLHPDRDGKPGILQIPLFLKLAAETYDGKPFNSKTELLEAYIDWRLNRNVRAWERGNFKNRNWAYQKIAKEPDWRKTRHYLSWLSQKLEQHNQIEFLIEKMQPIWLESENQRLAYRLLLILIFLLPLGVVFGLSGGLAPGIFVGTLLGLMAGKPDTINLREEYKLLWRELKVELFNWLIIGFYGGLFGGSLLVRLMEFKLIDGLFIGIALGLIGGLIIGLIIGAIGGKWIESKTKAYPNQGIWRSISASLKVSLIFGLPLGFICSLALESPLGLLAGLMVLFVVFIDGSGIQHVPLRLILWKQHLIPWNYAQFLNYCVERRLLQRIGGRYRFLHRELLEHFADKAGGVL